MAKFGEGHVSAMARLGLRELRSAAYPESNVAQSQEYGLYGTLTPGEVADSRRDGHDLEDEKGSSILAERMQQAEGRQDHEKDSREPPMERE